jgi:fatty-acyl-CoA synthase
MTDWNFASAYEYIADTVGDAPALICGDEVRTWSEYDSRAARLASLLSSYGLKKDSKVGICLHNSNEYLEAHHATIKLRGCPININYRYKEDELLYLIENSDAEALIFQDIYSDRIEFIKKHAKNVKCFIQVRFDPSIALMNGALDYERELRSANPMPRIDRSADDIYMLYTGGTTGMPKGVMYSGGALCKQIATTPSAGIPLPENLKDAPETILRIAEEGAVPRVIVGSPLMHGTGLWVGAMTAHLRGGAAITISTLGLDAELLWRQAERYNATFMTIVGDAFARPLLKALDDAKEAGKPFDLSSLKRISSSGVMFSEEVKQGLLKHLDIELIDLVGATEGSLGYSVSTREKLAETAVFDAAGPVKIFNEDLQEVKPGSGEVGKIACISNMVGYYKDSDKTKSISVEIDGTRWVFPGDYATAEADGKFKLLGRGSNCINTAGEKVFPEEVEEALKSHDLVEDCLVVGAKDERFGQKVAAVVSLNADKISGDELIVYCKEQISNYKAPKLIVLCDKISRMPNGKADYKWARKVVEEYISEAS